MSPVERETLAEAIARTTMNPVLDFVSRHLVVLLLVCLAVVAVVAVVEREPAVFLLAVVAWFAPRVFRRLF